MVQADIRLLLAMIDADVLKDQVAVHPPADKVTDVCRSKRRDPEMSDRDLLKERVRVGAFHAVDKPLTVHALLRVPAHDVPSLQLVVIEARRGAEVQVIA